jgi:hypothetical protein
VLPATSIRRAWAGPQSASASIAACAIVFTASSFSCGCVQPENGIELQAKHSEISHARAFNSSGKISRPDLVEESDFKDNIRFARYFKANKTAEFRGIFINPIIKFAKSITGSIAGVTTSVAPHEVLRNSFTPAFFLAVLSPYPYCLQASN